MKKIIIAIIAALMISGCTKKEFSPYVTIDKTVYEQNEEFDALSIIHDSANAGLLITVKESNVNTAVPGDYKVIYTITSANGKQSVEKTVEIIVKDYDAPVIEVSDVIELFIGDSFVIEKYVKAIDEREGDLTSSVHFEGVVNSFVAGDYPIRFIVSDSFGNTAEKEVTIRIKKAENSQPADYSIAGNYTDISYLDGQAPTLSIREDGTYTIFLNGCSVLRSADGNYVQYENIIYLLSDSYVFSDVPEKNVLCFVIQLDGSLCFDSELDLCAPNHGDIFKRQSDQ
ncbi:MAG: DUF5011 domain-containing protein [Erysipelotrichaceae bacterium]|nr:DUF5011 domain-containing protein [Erysipelotrichaceae bacterium]